MVQRSGRKYNNSRTNFGTSMTVVIKKDSNTTNVDKKTSQVVINKNTSSSSFSQFSANADSGSTNITSGETLTLTGGTGIATSVSGDTVTFNVESAVLLETENIDGGDYTP